MPTKRLIDARRMRKGLPRGFGWIDHRLLQEGYITNCTPQAWEGRKCRIQQENRHTNRSEKSSFKPVESDQFQIGPRSLFRAWTIQALSATVSATLRAVSPTLAPSRYAVSFTAEIMPCVSVDWPSPIHAESAATVAAAIPSESR